MLDHRPRSQDQGPSRSPRGAGCAVGGIQGQAENPGCGTSLSSTVLLSRTMRLLNPRAAALTDQRNLVRAAGVLVDGRWRVEEEPDLEQRHDDHDGDDQYDFQRREFAG